MTVRKQKQNLGEKDLVKELETRFSSSRQIQGGISVQPCTTTQSIDRAMNRWQLVERWCRLRLAVWVKSLAVAASFGTCCLSGTVWSQAVPWTQAEMTIASGAETKTADDKSLVALAQIGTVTFRETPLAEVILILSERWDVNIIAGADVQGQVNGTFKNESLKSILDSILLSNGLQYRQVGNSLVVFPECGHCNQPHQLPG